MRGVRFLQISDIHLESPCAGLPWEKGRRELRRVLSAAIDLAEEISADLLLLPGDIYEHENETSGTGRLLARELERASPTQVLVTPGNHDFYAAGTLWQRTPWPGNVHIFREDEIGEKDFPDLGVTIYGFGHNSTGMLPAVLQDWRAPGRGQKSILIFHGSLIGGGPTSKEVTCPFASGDIEETGVDYAAVGHYHSFAEIRSRDGRLIGAYAGCPAGRGFDEAGEKSVVLGEITDAGVTISTRTLARYRYERLELPLDGVTDERETEVRIREAVRTVSADEVIRLALTGRVPTEFDQRLVSIDDATTGRPHIELEWRVEPEYDVEAIAKKGTSEGAFVRELLERMEKAPSEEDKTKLRCAMHYGLDALSGRAPEQRE